MADVKIAGTRAASSFSLAGCSLWSDSDAPRHCHGECVADVIFTTFDNRTVGSDAPARDAVPAAEPRAEAGPALSRCLEDQHARLEELLAEFQRSNASGRSIARRRFAGFKRELERHIQWEEALLFPMLEAKTNRRGGPTAAMRREHAQIRRSLNAIAARLERRAKPLTSLQDGLLAILGVHNWKEERLIFPLIDRQASSRERRQLLRAMGRGPDRKTLRATRAPARGI